MYDLGPQFKLDLTKSKTPSSCVFRGNRYRISILSDTLIRFEYSDEGKFNDYPTFFASNRSFSEPKVIIEEDNNILIIKNDRFVIEYHKEKPFIGSKLLPEQFLKVFVNGTDKMWYFNHPEVRNLKGTSYSLEDPSGRVKLEKGLFSLDGFTSFDDSRTPILDANGNVLAPNYKNIDTYLFIYENDFGVGLKDYFSLTSLPPLIPRYALGVWWAKNEKYTETDIQNLVNKFRKYDIPFSVLLLGDYARRKHNNSEVSFTMNKEIFPNTVALANYLHQNHIFLGTNVKTDGALSQEELHFNEFKAAYKREVPGLLPINVYDSAFMDSFLKTIVTPYITAGIDMLWIDDKTNNNLRNFTMNYYLYNNFSADQMKRNMIMSRNYGIVPHKYSILYSGNTDISWKTLKVLPFYNSTASNIGVSWWSHDIGGFKGGTEDAELYMRYVQLGVYSPILRLSSEAGKYYKREPWKWDAKTLKVVHDYLNIRHRLIPYLYSEAKRYSQVGSPLIQPLYYKYPETYDEPLYKYGISLCLIFK